MALTFLQLKNHAQHALGDSTPSSLLDVGEIVNQAGVHLFSMHQWNMRERPEVTLDIIGSQPFVSLPDDFGEMLSYQMSDGLNNSMTMTTHLGLAELRANTVSITQNHYWGVLVYPRQVSAGVPPAPPRMDIWPEPSTTDLAAMTMKYRARWVPLVKDEDVADIQWYAENLLVSLVRAFAQGYEEDAVVPLDDRLAKIERGPVAVAARSTDGLAQFDYGRQMGGAISRQDRYGGTEWQTASGSPVADPA